MSDTEDKVALSDSETNMAGGDTEEKKESESSGKYGGQRRDNRRRRRVNSDEPIGPVVPIVLGSEVTKWGIRKKVWDSIEEHNLANFPRPVHHRIPNFKGAPAAAEKVLTMDVFKKANVVKVNPDKPQEQARFLTLEANKTLLVPTPRLRNGLFNKINPPGDCGKEILRICSTSQGVREYSSPVSLEDKVKIDLIITGSVAVSKEGFRIGKGEGFADLEFAMMRTMGAVDDNTVVVTTVHDHQIINIPEQIIEPHDLTVDYIVTPTEIIKTDCTKPKPFGIIWSKLDRDKLNRVPILKRLRKMEREAGKDVRLKGQEEDDNADDDIEEENPDEAGNENEDDPSRRRRMRRRRPRFQDNYRSGRGGGQPRPRRRSRENAPNSESGGEQQEERERRPRRPRNPRSGPPRDRRSHDPSIYVGGLPRSLRVSEFKDKIHERNVAPLRVVWHGGSGHAFLQFQNMDTAEEAVVALKELDIGGRQLKVEFARSNRGDDQEAGNEREIPVDKVNGADAQENARADSD